MAVSRYASRSGSATVTNSYRATVRVYNAPTMSTILEDVRSLQADSYAADTRLIAHHDLNGHGDGMQLVKHGHFLYVAHLGTSSMALSILDCSDPANPTLVRQIEHPANTHRHKVQIVGNVLIQNSEVPYFAKGDG